MQRITTLGCCSSAFSVQVNSKRRSPCKHLRLACCWKASKYLLHLLCSCSDVWNKFLEFESNVGDLSSILKVEKRRAAVIAAVSLSFLSLQQLHFAFLRSLFSSRSSRVARRLPSSTDTASSTSCRVQSQSSSPSATKYDSTLLCSTQLLLQSVILFFCQDVAKQSLTSLPLAAADSTRDPQTSADDSNTDSLVMPDLSQMLPYKPQVNVRKCAN